MDRFGDDFCEAIELNISFVPLRGQTIEVLGQRLNQFLGIPYAEPPIGDLRFAKTKPIEEPRGGVIDATRPKSACLQDPNPNLPNQSEDCLFLNIWSPNDTTRLKPVMFFIHGGGLVGGSIYEAWYNGSALAAHDIVLVTIQYRLGYFGFLYGNETSAPGNVGFHDQVLALHWVRDNIDLFGGDKNRITIFGESAGSWSVSALVLSPIAKGLFKRAILESGTIVWNKDRPPMTTEDALKEAKQLAQKVNCNDDKQWLQCLKNVNPKDIISEYKAANGIQFPTIGTEFLPLIPQKAFEQGLFNKGKLTNKVILKNC